MIRVAHRVILSSGWERRIIAFLAGACGALALAPVGFVPALIIPMTIAVWLIDGSARAGTRRLSPASLIEAAGAGWWLGFGYFVAGLWWLGSAFLVEADKFAWALPLGVLGLPAGLAFFTAAGFALARLVWSPGAGRILALSAALTFSEWLRGTLFTGFPWNDWGMALGGQLVLAQAASIVGLYGLTALAVAIAASPATLAGSGAALRLTPAIKLAIGATAGLAIFGLLRLTPGPVATEPGVRLRIMQPNITEDAGFSAENRDAILNTYLSLSDRSTSPATTGIADVTHLIWPESAFPFILSRDRKALERIGAALPEGVTLITGAARIGEAASGAPDTPGEPHYFNSIQVLRAGGKILESYDKVHLVPFGEYMPWSALLNKLGLQHFVHIPGGFEPGPQRQLLNVPGLPSVSPLVCYEAIFPGEVTPGSGERPQVLLNVTYDGWFGATAGPYQHLAQARLRSIEEGLPLVRAAGTGISAIIDPYGRIVGSLPVGVSDVLDGPLPVALPPTIFARFPLLAPFGLWLLILFGALLARWRA